MSESRNPYEQPPGAPRPDSAPAAPAHAAPASQHAAAAPGTADPPPAASGNAQVTGVLDAARRLHLSNPLPHLAVGLASYLAALMVAVLVLVSGIIAAAISGDPGGTTTTPDPGATNGVDDSGLGVLIGLLGLPAQIVALATFGSYYLQVDIDFGFGGIGSFSATANLRAVPLLVTLALVGTAFIGGWVVRRFQKRAGIAGMVLGAVLAGLPVAVLALALTRGLAMRISEAEITVMGHAAGADMFLGTWVLVTAPLLLGQLAGSRHARWWPWVSDLAAGTRLAIVHLLLVTVPAAIVYGLVAGVRILIEDGPRQLLSTLFALPLYAVNLLVYLAGFASLAPLSSSGHNQQFDVLPSLSEERLWLWDQPWYAAIGLLLWSLVVMVVVSLLWQHRRGVVPGSPVSVLGSWIALPLIYFMGGVVLLAVSYVAVGFNAGYFFGDTQLRFGIAPWLPVMTFLVGVVLEFVSRFAAPLAAPFVPGVLLGWIRGKDGAPASTPGADGRGAEAGDHTAPDGGAAPGGGG
ncbi:MAG: hypothetical protein Q4G40_11260, partial [Brachybacterium sp.]|nr:hypothetical protein [Brachybacterium sp.]